MKSPKEQLVVLDRNEKEIDKLNIELRELCKVDLNGLGKKKDITTKQTKSRLARWMKLFTLFFK